MARHKSPPPLCWEVLTAKNPDFAKDPKMSLQLEILFRISHDWTGRGPERLADYALRKAKSLGSWRYGEAEDFAQIGLYRFIVSIGPRIKSGPAEYLGGIITNVAREYYFENRYTKGIPPDSANFELVEGLLANATGPDESSWNYTFEAGPSRDAIDSCLEDALTICSNELRNFGVLKQDLWRKKFWNPSWRYPRIAEEVGKTHDAVRQAFSRMAKDGTSHRFLLEFARLLNDGGITKIRFEEEESGEN